MDRDWHTRSHTLSQPQQRPKDSQRGAQRPLTIWWWRSEMDWWGGGRDPPAFQLSPGRMPASPVDTGHQWGLGSGPRQSHWAPQPPAPAQTALPPHFGGLAPAGSHQEALPPSCSRSAIALMSENSEECSSDGITWNCSFFGENQTHESFLCQVLGWMGQLCVGVVFFFLVILFGFCFCFLIMFTICLYHSVFYKDSTSSPLPSPYPGLQG